MATKVKDVKCAGLGNLNRSSWMVNRANTGANAQNSERGIERTGGS